MIHGFAGFGVGFVLVPVLSFLYGPVAAVAISSSASVVASIPLLPGATHRMNRGEVFPVLAPVLLTVPLGAYALTLVEPLFMRKAIGVFVILSGLLLLRGYQWTGPRNIAVGLAVGGISGVIGGSTNTGGAIVTAYLLSAAGRAADKRAGILVITTAVSAIGFLTLVAIGAVDAITLLKALMLIAPNAAGIWLGARLFSGASDETYRRAALALLLIIGLATVIF